MKTGERHGKEKGDREKKKIGRRSTRARTGVKAFGMEGVLYVLQRILGEEKLDEGLRQVSDYILELFDLRFTAIFLRDLNGKTIRTGSVASRSGSLYFLRGISYEYGRSQNVEGWLKEIFSARQTMYGKQEVESFLMMLVGEGIVSEESFGPLLRLLEPLNRLSTVMMAEEDLRGSPFMVHVFSCDGKFSETEFELTRKITSIIALAVERRMEADKQARELGRCDALLESDNSIFFILSDGKLEYFSNQLSRMLGVTPEDLRGSALEEYLRPEDGDDLRKMIEAFMLSDDFTPRRYYHTYRLARDAREVEVDLRVTDLNGRRVLRGMIKEVGRSSLLERSVLEERRMESVETLAGGVAHDFNNLIGAIVGYASLVRNSLPEYDDRVKYMEKIEEAGARASKLTRQLLSISRKGKYKLEIVDMRGIVDRTCKGCIMPMDHISVIEEVKAEHLNVEGDPAQLYEALHNLCKNAREAMPEGGVINVWAENFILDRGNPIFTENMETGEYIRITVKDHGPGMDPEVLRRAADPFFTTKEKGRRRGLGLPAAIGIIENHKGKLLINSRMGEGTEVTVMLPVTHKTLEDDLSPYIGGEDEVIRILVVDDEEIVCSLASDMLKKLGYDCVTALSGGRALEIVSGGATRIDLVILDLVMPEMNGQDTFYRLREVEHDLPVIISSGYSESSVIQKLLKDGAVSFLRKPYRLGDISMALRDSLRITGRVTGGLSAYGAKE